MVLEFFIWGAWLPLIFGYLPSLGFSPGQQALILNAFPVASIVGMFFSNQWADRSASPERAQSIPSCSRQRERASLPVACWR